MDQTRKLGEVRLRGVKAAPTDIVGEVNNGWPVLAAAGDRAKVAREVGDALGMDEVVAEVLPAQKLEMVRAEQEAVARIPPGGRSPSAARCSDA